MRRKEEIKVNYRNNRANLKNTNQTKKENYFKVGSFKSWFDFQEGASKPNESVFLGNREYNLTVYYDDIDANPGNSKYIGRVIYPERRKEKWSFEKNMAFLAGLISAKREVLLLADIIKYYSGRKYQYQKSCTIIELLVLIDNGYTFSPDPQNPLQTVLQSSKPLAMKEIKIKNYDQISANTIWKLFNKSVLSPLYQKRSQLSNLSKKDLTNNQKESMVLKIDTNKKPLLVSEPLLNKVSEEKFKPSKNILTPNQNETSVLAANESVPEEADELQQFFEDGFFSEPPKKSIQKDGGVNSENNCLIFAGKGFFNNKASTSVLTAKNSLSIQAPSNSVTAQPFPSINLIANIVSTLKALAETLGSMSQDENLSNGITTTTLLDPSQNSDLSEGILLKTNNSEDPVLTAPELHPKNIQDNLEQQKKPFVIWKNPPPTEKRSNLEITNPESGCNL